MLSPFLNFHHFSALFSLTFALYLLFLLPSLGHPGRGLSICSAVGCSARARSMLLPIRSSDLSVCLSAPTTSHARREGEGWTFFSETPNFSLHSIYLSLFIYLTSVPLMCLFPDVVWLVYDDRISK